MRQVVANRPRASPYFQTPLAFPPLSGRTVVPNQSEENAAAALASVPGYKPNETALEKSQLVRDEIATEADKLKTSLKNEPMILPRKEIVSVVKKAINGVPEKSLLIQKSDPVITNYVRVAQNAADQTPGTIAGVLDMRQKLDTAYENARGQLAFGSEKISALDEVHSAARDALNEFLIKNAPNSDVKLSLQYQSALYRANDALQAKAIKEAGPSVARGLATLKQHPLVYKVVTAGLSGLGLGAGFKAAESL